MSYGRPVGYSTNPHTDSDVRLEYGTRGLYPAKMSSGKMDTAGADLAFVTCRLSLLGIGSTGKTPEQCI